MPRPGAKWWQVCETYSSALNTRSVWARGEFDTPLCKIMSRGEDDLQHFQNGEKPITTWIHFRSIVAPLYCTSPLSGALQINMTRRQSSHTMHRLARTRLGETGDTPDQHLMDPQKLALNKG